RGPDVPVRLRSGARLRRGADDRHRDFGVHGRHADPHVGGAMVAPGPAQRSRGVGSKPMKLLKLIPDNTNVKFLRWRVPFYAISILLMVASITLVMTKGLNLGVDFVGGQMVRATFAESSAPVAEVREEIDALGYGEPIIQQVGAANQISIRMKLPEGDEVGLADQMVGEIRTTLEQNHPGVVIGQARSVSGKVSGELFETGMIALLLASIGISIYIWIRFEWQFGVGALFALAHDVTLTLG